MTTDELGGGMDDDICSPLEGAAQIRCGEGVIHHKRDARLMSNCGYFFKREDVDARVAQSFAPYDFRIGANGATEVFRINRVDQCDIDPDAWESIDELVIGATVESGGLDDMVTRPA